MTVFHQLKVWPEFVAPIMDGRKNFEVRKNDRDYRVGDVLNLREFDPRTELSNPRREVSRRVIYVLEGDGRFGIAQGFVVLGLGPV